MNGQSESEFVESFNNLNEDYRICEEQGRLCLKSLKHKDWLPFYIDFSSNEITRRKNQLGLNQEISKAVGIKKGSKLKVLDATAGLGRDAFMMASLGCSVIMLERNQVIFTLLKNAMDLYKTKNMELINVDSIEFLKNNNMDLDVIYIDPMFPKSKKSRLVKKDMQIFREIIGDDLDSGKLLDVSLKQKAKRVVVKRMINSEFLNDMKPSFQIKGKTTRFDVYTQIN